jgi:shikimate dehydrogenase
MSEVKTYTLSDLDDWSFDGTALAVIGHPIKHSVSPQMHNAALAEMARHDARFATWKYFRFEITPEQLPDALGEFYARGFHGINLTVPHKILAMNHVSDVVKSAQRAEATNTLLRTHIGWQGHNTDGEGMRDAIKEELLLALGDKIDVLLLGAGGAARGAAVECLECGVRSLYIANRTASTRDALIAQIKPLSANIPIYGLDPASLPNNLPENLLVINATSAGLKPADPLPVDLASLATRARLSGVYDMIYNPPETPLLAQARALGIPAANGLSMLVHQGARALEIWTDAPVPVDAMRAAVHSAMKAHA